MTSRTSHTEAEGAGTDGFFLAVSDLAEDHPSIAQDLCSQREEHSVERKTVRFIGEGSARLMHAHFGLQLHRSRRAECTADSRQ